jgi:hypothetical protein
VAREFNRLEENPPQVDLNGQEIGYHESDYWDPIAASIHRMGGSGNFIWIDNKRGENSSIAATPPFDGGYIQRATAVESGVFTFVEDSWVNANEVRGMATKLGLPNGPFPASPGHFNDDERCGSTIRDWIGVEVGPVIQSDETVEVLGHVGCFIADQDPQMFGGRPLVNPGLIGDREQRTLEKSASLITRSHVVIGDGRASDGWGTDVLYVNGMIRPAGLLKKPEIEAAIPDPDLAGAIYFDLERNCLRVAVPFMRHRGQPNEQKGLMWRDLAFVAPKDGEAEENLVKPDPSLEGVNLNNWEADKQVDFFDKAGKAAEQSDSPFLAPDMSIITVDGKLPRGADVTLIFNNARANHFEQATFKLAWKRVSGGQHGRYGRGEVPWTPISSASYTVNAATRTVEISGIDFGRPGPDGATGEDMLVQIMAVTSRGYTTGAAFQVF